MSFVFFLFLRLRTSCHRGLVYVPLGPRLFLLHVLFVVHPSVGASSRAVGTSSVLVYQQGLVCVPSGTCVFFKRTRVQAVAVPIICRLRGLRLAAVACEVG